MDAGFATCAKGPAVFQELPQSRRQTHSAKARRVLPTLPGSTWLASSLRWLCLWFAKGKALGSSVGKAHWTHVALSQAVTRVAFTLLVPNCLAKHGLPQPQNMYLQLRQATAFALRPRHLDLPQALKVQQSCKRQPMQQGEGQAHAATTTRALPTHPQPAH